MSTYELTPRARAVLAGKDQIRRFACDVHGAHRIETPVDGYQVLTRTELDDPVAGIRAAVLARSIAAAEIRCYAEQARAGGRSWDEIGEAIGLEEAGAERGELAFGLVVENRPLPFHPPFELISAWWRCGSCGERVRDRGPFEANPANTESGHASSCRRHAAEIAAYRMRAEA
ncbi:hypothetical protein GCM10009836_43700 [Pseudonocardia ailaonensis]|uniref:Uncharacterized protein n=1 Tax=Pseudonocardia ailaonensis TaxID=367279 RepID=A0ABN2NBR1_9PSEU